VIEKKKGQEDSIAALKKLDLELEKKLDEKTEKLNNKMKPIKDITDQCNIMVKQINKDSLAKVYKYFEKKSNDSVIFIFEALVGIMRG
jgi:hypothetical protein